LIHAKPTISFYVKKYQNLKMYFNFINDEELNYVRPFMSKNHFGDSNREVCGFRLGIGIGDTNK
jgi:hypothetical protein